MNTPYISLLKTALSHHYTNINTPIKQVHRYLRNSIINWNDYELLIRNTIFVINLNKNTEFPHHMRNSEIFITDLHKNLTLDNNKLDLQKNYCFKGKKCCKKYQKKGEFCKKCPNK